MVILGSNIVRRPKLQGPPPILDGMAHQALSPQIKTMPGGN